MLVEYYFKIKYIKGIDNIRVAREALLHVSTSLQVETSSGTSSLWWLSAEAMVESCRSVCSALALRFCSVKPAMRTKYRPQQHQEPYCLRLRLLLYYLGRPIKGNWDTKTTWCTTTWLAARPETGLIQLVDGDMS